VELGVNNGVHRRLPPPSVHIVPLALFRLFPGQTSLHALVDSTSHRRDRSRTHTRTRALSLSLSLSPQVHPVPQTRPRFVDPFRLVLSPRSCSRSKLRLPTALGVSRKSRRELYLSLERREVAGEEEEADEGSKGEPVSRFPAGARYWSRRGAP